MGNRKDKPWYFRLLGSVSAFVLLGAVIYVVFAGFNVYSTSILLAGATGVAVPGVVLGDTFLEMVLGAFETFFDGIMEVLGGIAEAISSIFG